MSGYASNRLRTYVLTGGVAAITATGAWYGAGLKTRQEFNTEKQTLRQASATERIEQMEQTKSRLVKQKHELQIKIDRLNAKAKDQSHAPP